MNVNNAVLVHRVPLTSFGHELQDLHVSGPLSLIYGVALT